MGAVGALVLQNEVRVAVYEHLLAGIERILLGNLIDNLIDELHHVVIAVSATDDVGNVDAFADPADVRLGGSTLGMVGIVEVDQLGQVAVHGLHGAAGGILAVAVGLYLLVASECQGILALLVELREDELLQDVAHYGHSLECARLLVVHIADDILHDIAGLDGHVQLLLEVLDGEWGELGGTRWCPLRNELLQHRADDVGLDSTHLGLVGDDRRHVAGRLGNAEESAHDLQTVRVDVLAELLLQLLGVDGAVATVGCAHLALHVVGQEAVVLQREVYTGCNGLLLEVGHGHLHAFTVGCLLLELGNGGLEILLGCLQLLDLCLQVGCLLAAGIKLQALLGGQGLGSLCLFLILGQVAQETSHELLAVFLRQQGLLLVGEHRLAFVVLGECLDTENCQYQTHDLLKSFHTQ